MLPNAIIIIELRKNKYINNEFWKWLMTRHEIQTHDTLPTMSAGWLSFMVSKSIPTEHNANPHPTNSIHSSPSPLRPATHLSQGIFFLAVELPSLQNLCVGDTNILLDLNPIFHVSSYIFRSTEVSTRNSKKQNGGGKGTV